ncbi:LysE family transporter [Otariodibacter sp.]|uniref:LysE family transporter n=1 Tax=Otariodibacter sp. TaxID=3030919 RepID=UPI00262A110C|nr:LysE family transporter [Otariodibacter sp.]
MWTIFFVQLAGLISPGPDFLYVTRKAMGDSRKNAILASLGITLGIAFWSLLVIFGLAIINNIIPNFQYILMLFGGAYLAYCGLKMVQVTKNTQLSNKKTEEKKSIWKEILGGLLINLSNPKIIIFFSSVLAGYVSNLSNIQDILLVLFILTGSGFAYFSLVSLLFSHNKIQLFYIKYSHYLDNMAGVIFIIFGVSLIYEGIVLLFFQ